MNALDKKHAETKKLNELLKRLDGGNGDFSVIYEALEIKNKQLKKTIDCLWDKNMIVNKSKREIKQNYRSMKENRDYWAERCSVHRKRIAYLELPFWIKIKRYFNKK